MTANSTKKKKKKKGTEAKEPEERVKDPYGNTAKPATDWTKWILELYPRNDDCLFLPTLVASAKEMQKRGFAPTSRIMVQPYVESEEGSDNSPDNPDPESSSADLGSVALLLTEGEVSSSRAYVPPQVFQSLGLRKGDLVVVTKLEKYCVCRRMVVDAPEEMLEVRQGSGDSFHQYVTSCLEASIYFQTNIIRLSLYGKSYDLKVMQVEKDRDLPALFTRQSKLEIVHESQKKAEAAKSSGGSSLGLGRVGGLRHVVKELQSFLQLPLEKPQAYRKLGVRPPKGVLLYGPPGTGKTLLAKSLAEEVNCHVELCNATDLVSKYAGESEERIKNVFEKCAAAAHRSKKGALLFIDEIDAICPNREEATESERRVVATFLTLLDGTGSDDAVIVLGATNRPNAIDPALRRAGRLEREVEVGVPNAQDRLAILRIHSAPMEADISEEQLKTIAGKTHGFVGADLASLCAQAAVASISRKSKVDWECFEAAMRIVRPSALKELYVEVPTTRWTDIGGYEEAKHKLQEMVEWPIKYAAQFQAMNLTPPKGVLLYGPPGCSKTMMAKAVATESEMNFISVKGPELFSKWVGESEKAVRELFRKARTASPCVIFFDEVDAIGTSREQDSSGVGSRVLSQMLNEMDGIAGAQQVIVIAATNQPDILDSALMRPGRFDRLLHITLPDEPARMAMLEWNLARIPHHFGDDMDKDDRMDELVARTKGYSGAETVMVVRESALAALRESLEQDRSDAAVTWEHIESALHTVTPRIPEDLIDFYYAYEDTHRVK